MSTLRASDYLNVVSPNESVLKEALGFNASLIDSTDSAIISMYVLVLSQYLISFTYEVNNYKSEVLKGSRVIDNIIFQSTTSGIKKKYKTKKDLYTYLINSNPKLLRQVQELDNLRDLITQFDGISDSISELIMSFKRELTRRKEEFKRTV